MRAILSLLLSLSASPLRLGASPLMLMLLADFSRAAL